MPNQGAGTTVLRWAGSKRQLVPLLSEYWQESGAKRYIEPFAGSACLFFNIQAGQAVLGDINEDLIQTYERLQKNPLRVRELLKAMPGNKRSYYKFRATASEDADKNFQAARFIYLNRFCFNGLYRTNRAGEFNVPYGGGALPSDETIAQSAKLLKNATLVAGDFELTLNHVKKGDFVYMDPPFSVENKRVFNDYDASRFGMADLIRLKKWMTKLDRRKIPFVVSYLDSKEARYLREGFFHRTVSVRRSIAGFASNRRKAREALISNFELH